MQSTSQFLGKFLSNQLSSNLFSKNATFTKFLPDESKFRNFPTELYSVENRRAIACNFLLHKNLLREMAYNVFIFVIRSLISRIFSDSSISSTILYKSKFECLKNFSLFSLGCWKSKTNFSWFKQKR